MLDHHVRRDKAKTFVPKGKPANAPSDAQLYGGMLAQRWEIGVDAYDLVASFD
jgi:hypothetical protein